MRPTPGGEKGAPAPCANPPPSCLAEAAIACGHARIARLAPAPAPQQPHHALLLPRTPRRPRRAQPHNHPHQLLLQPEDGRRRLPLQPRRPPRPPCTPPPPPPPPPVTLNHLARAHSLRFRELRSRRILPRPRHAGASSISCILNLAQLVLQQLKVVEHDLGLQIRVAVIQRHVNGPVVQAIVAPSF